MFGSIKKLQEYLIKQIQEDEMEKDAEQRDELSEMEAAASETDYLLRKYLLELLEYKHQIQSELEREDLSVLREQQLQDSLSVVDQNIQKVRFSGIL